MSDAPEVLSVPQVLTTGGTFGTLGTSGSAN
jgi:hypothetical protein